MTVIKQVHLVVFVHGLWGNPSHLQYVVDLFSQTHGDKLHLLNAKCNTSDYTYDGVDLCGKRLVGEIKEELQTIRKMNIEVNKFSIFGYSLGGLVARYAIGLLYLQGFFKDVEPIFFTTFATPHIGIRREKISSFWGKFISWSTSNFLSRTGEQLHYIDKFEGDKPLLYVMSKLDTIFYKALESFKYRKTYANAYRDNSVPFWSAAITDVNPFEQNLVDMARNEKCADIVESISLRLTAKDFFAQDNSMKFMPTYALLVLTLPILIIPISIAILSILPGKLSKSKLRIQQDEEDGELEIYLDGLKEDIGATNAEENIVETEINLKNLVDNPTSVQEERQSDPIRLSNFATSPLFPKIELSPEQHESFVNLNKLQLDKVVVCMDDAIHPHASIIVRTNFHNYGKELLKLYVEEVFQP